jgi:hypothetical protein
MKNAVDPSPAISGTGIARLIKKLVFLNEWPRSYCWVNRSAHAHALLAPPELILEIMHPQVGTAAGTTAPTGDSIFLFVTTP